LVLDSVEGVFACKKMNTTRTGSEIIACLDALPVSRLHVATVVGCALGLSFDLGEIAFGGALSAIFSAPPHSLSAGELSWLLSSVYIGAIVGAPLFGWLADRFGRKSMLTIALLLLAVTSMAAAASPDFVWLAVFRGLSGLALGAYRHSPGSGHRESSSGRGGHCGWATPRLSA
jgi:putative MFS transporter